MILISTFVPLHLFHHHHHHQLLLHHHNTVTTIVISLSRQATVHYIYEREEDERTHPNPQAKKIFVMFDFPMLLQVSFSSKTTVTLFVRVMYNCIRPSIIANI